MSAEPGRMMLKPTGRRIQTGLTIGTRENKKLPRTNPLHPPIDDLP